MGVGLGVRLVVRSRTMLWGVATLRPHARGRSLIRSELNFWAAGSESHVTCVSAIQAPSPPLHHTEDSRGV